MKTLNFQQLKEKAVKVFDLIEDANYFCVDAYANAFWYEKNVREQGIGWGDGGNCGFLGKYNYTDDWTKSLIKREWKPKMGEGYYFPDPCGECKYLCCVWYDKEHDKRRLSRGLVCKTTEEAIEKADKMLEVIKPC